MGGINILLIIFSAKLLIAVSVLIIQVSHMKNIRDPYYLHLEDSETALFVKVFASNIKHSTFILCLEDKCHHSHYKLMCYHQYLHQLCHNIINMWNHCFICHLRFHLYQLYNQLFQYLLTIRYHRNQRKRMMWWWNSMRKSGGNMWK